MKKLETTIEDVMDFLEKNSALSRWYEAARNHTINLGVELKFGYPKSGDKILCDRAKEIDYYTGSGPVFYYTPKPKKYKYETDEWLRYPEVGFVYI